MMLYLKSLPIKMNEQTKKIYQAILTIKKILAEALIWDNVRRVSENSPEEKAHHNEYKKEL